jgi:hypothetical protein
LSNKEDDKDKKKSNVTPLHPAVEDIKKQAMEAAAIPDPTLWAIILKSGQTYQMRGHVNFGHMFVVIDTDGIPILGVPYDSLDHFLAIEADDIAS